MENIREFAETIKGIQMSQVIDIGIAILIYILFRCLSKSLAYMTVRIFKPKTKNKKAKNQKNTATGYFPVTVVEYAKIFKKINKAKMRNTGFIKS